MEGKLVYERYMGDGAWTYVYFYNGLYDVYETGMYGGAEYFLESYDTLKDVIDCADNLT